jgi:hypothetical protein
MIAPPRASCGRGRGASCRDSRRTGHWQARAGACARERVRWDGPLERGGEPRASCALCSRSPVQPHHTVAKSARQDRHVRECHRDREDEHRSHVTRGGTGRRPPPSRWPVPQQRQPALRQRSDSSSIDAVNAALGTVTGTTPGDGDCAPHAAAGIGRAQLGPEELAAANAAAGALRTALLRNAKEQSDGYR